MRRSDRQKSKNSSVGNTNTAILKLSPKKGLFNSRSKQIFLISMLAIPITHWLVFWLYVNLSSITLAFQAPTGGWSITNFVQVWDGLTKEGNELGIAFVNTLRYFVTSVVIIMPGSLIISYFIFKHIKFYGFFRVIFYLPAIVSSVVLTTVYKQFLKPWGPIGVFAEMLGIHYPETGLLGNPETATLAIIAYCIWTGFCGNMLVFGGAMSRIPVSVLEAAKIEGCGPFREIRSIVIPLIWPTLSTIIIFTMTGLFNASGPILLLVNGQNNTSTLSFWIYKLVNGNGFGGGGQYNLVSAAGLCFTAVAVPITLTLRHFLEKRNNVEY